MSEHTKNILLLLFTMILIGCEKQHPSLPLLLNAERLIETYPDSANIILAGIPSPDALSIAEFSLWCMLKGKVADKLNNNNLPSPCDLDRALAWYMKHGSTEDQAKMQLYLGRSYYADGEYDKAMSNYVEALHSAKNNGLFNTSGYICTYIADLYNLNDMPQMAMNQYEDSKVLFEKAGNRKSHIYAIRNIARQWCALDSFDRALCCIKEADSLAQGLSDKRIQSIIENAFGNIYRDLKRYEEAEDYYIKSVSYDSINTTYSYLGLINLYLETGFPQKARMALNKVSSKFPPGEFSIKKAYYRINKAEGNYQSALENLEEYQRAVDSITMAQHASRVLEIEKKYSNFKLREKVNELTIQQQRYIIILCICVFFLSVIIFMYFLYKQKIKNKLDKQTIELAAKKIELLNSTIELEEKRQQLSQLVDLKDKNEGAINELQEEIDNLTQKYHQLQRVKINSSPIYKKLLELTNHKAPREEGLLTEKLWNSIVEESTDTFPNLKSHVYSLCLELTEQEWKYCCLVMFNFDSNIEADLLGISPNSVSKKRVRLRQRLGLNSLPKTTLYEHLLTNL